ncbi:MAG: gamma-glutamyl-gamma-aminobutyrate hydrolase family protein [Terriglobia bacterium]
MKILVSVKGADRERGLESPYAKALMAAGANPEEIELVTFSVPPSRKLEAYDGFLFAGGEDVDPSFYDEARRFENVQVNRTRDDFEFKLFDSARHHRQPVLGICRGIQVINVRFGGTLYQDLKSETALDLDHRQEGRRSDLTHSVTLTDPESKLAAAFKGSCRVNSLHHQAIRRLGHGLKVIGRSEDGLVEAVEAADDYPFLLAVQWHPEEIASHPEQRKIFELFLNKCREFAVERSAQAHA